MADTKMADATATSAQQNNEADVADATATNAQRNDEAAALALFSMRNSTATNTAEESETTADTSENKDGAFDEAAITVYGKVLQILRLNKYNIKRELKAVNLTLQGQLYMLRYQLLKARGLVISSKKECIIEMLKQTMPQIKIMCKGKKIPLSNGLSHHKKARLQADYLEKMGCLAENFEEAGVMEDDEDELLNETKNDDEVCSSDASTLLSTRSLRSLRIYWCMLCRGH